MARVVTLAPARTCRDCRHWPCRCRFSITRIEPAALVRDCACGRQITVGTSLPEDVFRGVQMHNDTPQHQRWRFRSGL
jgi:hypothetical protein